MKAPWVYRAAFLKRTSRPYFACWTRGSQTTWSLSAPSPSQPFRRENFYGIFVEAYLAEAHVLLDRVHLVPELRSRGVHVGDHGPDVADDGGKDEHADEEVDGDEEVLEISLWLRCLSDGGEGEGGPVEAVDEDVDWFTLDLSKS